MIRTLTLNVISIGLPELEEVRLAVLAKHEFQDSSIAYLDERGWITFVVRGIPLWKQTLPNVKINPRQPVHLLVQAGAGHMVVSIIQDRKLTIYTNAPKSEEWVLEVQDLHVPIVVPIFSMEWKGTSLLNMTRSRVLHIAYGGCSRFQIVKDRPRLRWFEQWSVYHCNGDQRRDHVPQPKK